ncbi:MAG: hypothetical protein FH749_14145 [Firmicutes bacterium]|nr:hypothetical protein [Bacillota bacterium]
MNFWLGFRAMFKKELLIIIRYIANTMGGMLTFYLVFLLIFLGYRGVAGAGASFGEGTGHLIVGYTTWL